MSVQPTVVERFSFTDRNGREAICRIEILPAADDRVAVIATELVDNPGMSVTNAAEKLASDVCRRFELPPLLVTWIEFYGYPAGDDPNRLRTYDLVSFARVGGWPGVTLLFHGPSWRPMADSDWQKLGIEPRRDRVKIDLGHLVITANAKETLNAQDVAAGVFRHARGDWGELCDEDRRENERSLQHAGRLFSVYHDRERVKFYVITEHDRSVTTVLLPEDY